MSKTIVMIPTAHTIICVETELEKEVLRGCYYNLDIDGFVKYINHEIELGASVGVEREDGIRYIDLADYFQGHQFQRAKNYWKEPKYTDFSAAGAKLSEKLMIGRYGYLTPYRKIHKYEIPIDECGIRYGDVKIMLNEFIENEWDFFPIIMDGYM